MVPQVCETKLKAEYIPPHLIKKKLFTNRTWIVVARTTTETEVNYQTINMGQPTRHTPTSLSAKGGALNIRYDFVYRFQNSKFSSVTRKGMKLAPRPHIKNQLELFKY